MKLTSNTFLLTLAMGVVVCQSARAEETDCGCNFRPAKTGLIRGGDDAQSLSVDVEGVKDLYLRVTFGGDSYDSDQAIWADPTLIDAEGDAIDLTTVTPIAVQVGWGRLFTNTNQHNSGLTIAGQAFEKGFWAHGPSLLHFKLDGKYQRFQTRIGIDTGAGRKGSVEFEVLCAKPAMPEPAVYKGVRGPRQPTLASPKPAADSAHTFHAAGAVKYLRVLEEVPRPWAVRKSWYRDDRDGMAHSAIGNGFLGLKVQYGVVPVEKDGSAHFRVPAMRNIYLQALDENYLAIQTERTYVHYMPGETRSCIGCHETPHRTQTQGAHVPLAMQRAASEPAAQADEATARKLFDYDRDIQPIWDKHCVECHGAVEPDGGLNLCGDAVGTYSVSYNNLIKLSKGPNQLLGNRKPRDENVGSAGVEYLPPYTLGALTSPLAAMCSAGKITLRNADHQAYVDRLAESHRDVRMSDREFLALTNWLDVNCPFHRSYWGRLNAKYQDHPDYRPEVTFDEAIQRTVPQSVVEAEAAAGKVSTADAAKCHKETTK